uniref:TIDP3108 n=1 Tax=Arundo donax TaxID=35708 RepID=A0A0A9FDU6_ARUDO
MKIAHAGCRLFSIAGYCNKLGSVLCNTATGLFFLYMLAVLSS